MLSHVLRPIITAFLLPGLARLVTRAKYAISFFSPVQGNVPPRPIPILLVAATIKVSSLGVMVESLSRGEDSTGLDIMSRMKSNYVVVEEQLR